MLAFLASVKASIIHNVLGFSEFFGGGGGGSSMQ